MKIGNVEIGQGQAPFIVAELSGNHNGSLERALMLVDAAAASGVHAIKIQTYTAESMTLDIRTGDFVVSDPASPWHKRTLYDLYHEAHTPLAWHESIFRRCQAHGILAFSTPFDCDAVDFLETLNVPCYKIASFENIHLPLIRKVASTGKPILLSTGMASIAELDEAVKTARDSGCLELALLKCTSAYPSSPKYSNIATIPHMRELFNCEVGLSDHTLGIGVALCGVALGASIIEKHFTSDRSTGGVDSHFSMEPPEMQLLVEESLRAWQSLGEIGYGPTPVEQNSKIFRRSLYITCDMKEGDLFTQENLRPIRPGYGMSPAHYELLLGKAVNRDVSRGTPATWDLLG